MEHRQTLAELIKNDEHPALMPKMYGHIQATLFDTKTGRIKQQISQKNLVTAAYYAFVTSEIINTLYVTISNDAEDPHYYKHICMSTFQDTSWINTVRTLDYPNKVYTYIATFTGVTAPGRTVNLVNLAIGGPYTHATYVKLSYKSLTSVKLNSSIYQTPSDSLEIVYRLSFVRV